jgi:hypothetical protein
MLSCLKPRTLPPFVYGLRLTAMADDLQGMVYINPTDDEEEDNKEK